MNGIETILYWAAVVLLGASLFCGLLAFVFGRRRPLSLAEVLLAAATAVLTAFGIERWAVTGHPPFVSLFESMIASIWFLLVIYQAVRLRLRSAVVALAPAAGISLLLMGWSSSLPGEASPLSAALKNVWLFVHASFATAGAGTFLVGAAYAAVYLAGERARQRMLRVVPGVPELGRIPGTMVTFQLFGLILWGVMIVSGSIWAHVAWGRYWAWDPVELWSLISWLAYGLLYHARLTLRVSDRLFCILTIVAVATVAFALWGVHYVYETLHTYG